MHRIISVLSVMGHLVLSDALNQQQLKYDFRLAAARADRGFRALRGSRSQIARWASELESIQSSDPTFCPTSSPQLLGRWYLDYCDAADVLSLQLLPGLNVGEIWQEIRIGDASGSFDATNTVAFQPPGPLASFSDALPSLEYSVEAACNAISDTKLTLVFVGGSSRLAGTPVELPAISGRLPASVVQGLQSLIGERVYLETTYLDDDFRIARGPGQELYVLSKRELPEPQQAKS